MGETILILLLVLVLFGATRLPRAATGLGKAIRGFKDAMAGKDEAKPPAPPDRAAGEQAPGGGRPKA